MRQLPYISLSPGFALAPLTSLILSLAFTVISSAATNSDGLVTNEAMARTDKTGWRRKAEAIAGVDPGSKGLHQSQTMVVDGVEREFSYFVPRDGVGKLLPMVIYLHGHGDNMRHILGEGRVKSASSQWMNVADRERFLVFYPLGVKAGRGRRTKPGWNDCRTDAKGNPQVDDVKYVRQLIEFAAREFNLDRSRIYVTGTSNGGHMAMRVAMEVPNEVAAIATVVALLPKATKCTPPTRPVPILMMHGTADPIAPYNGGSMAGNRGEVYSAQVTADRWAKWNNVERLQSKVVEVANNNRDDDSKIIKHVRERSPDGDAIIAYEIQGAGHTEPSRTAKISRLLKRILGKQNNDVEMAEIIWDFFKNRSR